MNYLNKGEIKRNYYLIIIQLLTVFFIISPIIKSQSQSQYSGTVETDKYNIEYQVTNLNVPFKYVFSLNIIKETKEDSDNSIVKKDTIKLILYLQGYKPSGNSSIWSKFLNKGQKNNNSPFQIFIKGTKGYFKMNDILANYEFSNSATKELFMSPKVTTDDERETLTITNNSKFAIQDAVELFINACWNKEKG